MASKKSFKSEMAAASYITQPQGVEASQQEKESKSKRLNLLITPSLSVNLAKIATMNRTSVNDLINRVLAEYVEGQASTVKKYDDVFGG